MGAGDVREVGRGDDGLASVADAGDELVARVRDGGQTVITTTDLAHVPHADEHSVVKIAVEGGEIQRAGGGLATAVAGSRT